MIAAVSEDSVFCLLVGENGFVHVTVQEKLETRVLS